MSPYRTCRISPVGEAQDSNQGELEASPSSIRLDHYLKWIGKARSGGEAKHRIQAGEVLVNGVVETRRSRKVAPGDRVTMDGETREVELPVS